jgi:hypothetical protein
LQQTAGTLAINTLKAVGDSRRQKDTGTAPTKTSKNKKGKEKFKVMNLKK